MPPLSIAKGFEAPRRWILLTAVCLALVNLVVFAIGVPRLHIYSHDVFVSLDGGWRVLNGQRPVVDFYAQMGPLYYLLHATGLALAGGDARGLGYGSSIASALIAVWSFLLLRRRMLPAAFFLACLAVTLLAASPVPLGLEPWRSTFSMKHNRYCFALAILVLLESFLPPPLTAPGETRRAIGFGSGFSSGLACGVMLFVKISYGFVGLGLGVVSVLLRPRERGRTIGIAAGFIAGTLPVLVWLRFDFDALLGEYRLLAAVRGADISPFAFAKAFFDNRFETCFALLPAILTVLLPVIAPRRRFTIAIATLLAAGAGYLLLLTNTQERGLPLLAGVALLIVNELSAIHDPRDTKSAFILCFALLAVAVPLATDAAGLSLALADKWVEFQPGYRFDAPHLQSLEFVDYNNGEHFGEENDNGQAFVQFTSEAIALVEGNSTPAESVRGLGFSNPFSYAMLRRPSRSGSVNISHTNVGEKAIASRERLIGDVDLILVPHYLASERRTMAIVLRRYPELLGRDYALVASSPHWELYRKRTLAGQ